jgi:hypothetical protein
MRALVKVVSPRFIEPKLTVSTPILQENLPLPVRR